MSGLNFEQPKPLAGAVDEALPEIELASEDIVDAMSHLSGYLDISIEDFRSIYHLAHRHAVDRLFSSVYAELLMQTGFKSLSPNMNLYEAAHCLIEQRRHGLPVVDADDHLCGMFFEADFLHYVQAESFFELLFGREDDCRNLLVRCREIRVADVMCVDFTAVGKRAGFRELTAAFHRHGGADVPVVDTDGCICGLLQHREFISACHLENLP